MKKYKFLLLAFFLIIFTGCQNVVNITVNKDLSVKEETTISEPSSFWENYYMTSPRSIVNDALKENFNKKFLTENNYQYKIAEDYRSVTLIKEFSSIENYVNTSKLYNGLFDKLIYTENGNIITVKTIGFKSYLEYAENIEWEMELVDSARINISLPFVVTDSNADKVDKRNNIYTWTVNTETENKEIFIEFDKSRPFLKYLDIYVSIVILLIILVAFLIWYLRIKKANKINNKLF